MVYAIIVIVLILAVVLYFFNSAIDIYEIARLCFWRNDIKMYKQLKSKNKERLAELEEVINDSPKKIEPLTMHWTSAPSIKEINLATIFGSKQCSSTLGKIIPAIYIRRYYPQREKNLPGYKS